MVQEKVQLTHKQADGYVIPLGPLNLVNIVTDVGMAGCGAFDIAALNALGYPAVRIKATGQTLISTIEDLLSGEVKEINNEAAKLGITTGMILMIR
jgi:uncharacterized protein YunC (DUF1805 family)